MADLLPIAVCIRPGSADVIKYVFYPVWYFTYTFTFRSAQPRLSNEQAQQMFDKGRSIEQDFADSFTGQSMDDYY